MSYEVDRGGWTEDELAAGVHILASGFVTPEFEEEDESWPPTAWDSEALFDAAGAELLVGALLLQTEIRKQLAHYVLEGEKHLIIERYARRERLPAEFTAAAARPDAIPILIKSFLKKVLRAYPSENLAKEIMAFSSALLLNEEQRTSFDRVGSVQAYIHAKADETQGPAAHLDLPSKLMKNLLSSCRLHLGLQDMFGAPPAYWNEIWDTEIARSEKEALQPKAGFIPIGKRRIQLWRVPQLKPLTHFACRQTRNVLNGLAKLPMELPVEEYRALALSTLSADLEAEPLAPQRSQSRPKRNTYRHDGPAPPDQWDSEDHCLL